MTGSWSPIPALAQLFSILSSNPLLQELALCGSSPHVSDSDRFPPQVPLRHLKKFRLSSDFCYASPLLNQLDLPDKMDNLNLSLSECSPSDLSQTLRPYLGDYIRRRGGLPDGGLGLLIIYDIPTFHLCVGDEHNCDDPTGKMYAVWSVPKLTIVKMAHFVPIFHKFPGDCRHHRPLFKLSSNVAPKVRLSSEFINDCRLS